jgi:hypothetical protein
LPVETRIQIAIGSRALETIDNEIVILPDKPQT